MSVKLLDCTLRDGGHVNEWNFGEEKISSIITDLINSKIDIIELGFLQNCNSNKNYTLYNHIEEAYELVSHHNNKAEFSVMARSDRYDINKLSISNNIIQNIRVAFYPQSYDSALSFCKQVVKKKYKCYLNAVNVMGLSKNELCELIKKINDFHPTGYTIVDTFGSMKLDDIKKIYDIVEENLDKDIQLGLHLHDNLTLSLSIAQLFLQLKESSRNVIIDASALGMGRIPGNLCMELIMDHLNRFYNKDYFLEPILNTIYKNIEPIKKQYEWGYSVAYFLSAKFNIHRTYAEYLMKKQQLSYGKMMNIFRKIEPEKKMIFDQKYIEMLYVSECLNVPAEY